MCEKLQKLDSLKRLVNSPCCSCDNKSEIQSLIADLELLIKTETPAERIWEMTSLAMFGTDGLGGMKRIASKVLETLESIERMPPETAASMAPHKAKLVLSYINEEKKLARG